MSRSVDDLDAEEVLVYTARSGGSGTTVHRRPNDCPPLQRHNINALRVDFAGDLFADWEVCEVCDPDVDADTGADNDSTYDTRAAELKDPEITPADAEGLTPLEGSE